MKIIFAFLLFSCSALHSQNNYSKIKYYSKNNNKGTELLMDCVLQTDSNAGRSIFTELGPLNVPSEVRTETKDINGNTFVNIQTFEYDYSNNVEYQKDFKDDSLITHTDIYGESDNYLVKEKMPALKWEVTTDTLTILNYKTQKVTLNFRGRNYNGWFANEIPISDGPFKFHGLPGLILKIQSVDGKYTFEAYELNLNKSTLVAMPEDIRKKYSGRKVISIQQALSLQKNNIDKERKFTLGKGTGVSEVKIDIETIERNIDDLKNGN